MLSSKLHSPAQLLRKHQEAGTPLPPDVCGLMAEMLDDIAERVAVLEHQPVPPTARVIPLRAVQVAA